jgi:hypothetical protein
VVRHGDVEGNALHVLRRLGAADGAVVLGAPVGRAQDQRLAHPHAQRLQLVEGRLVDEAAAATPFAESWRWRQSTQELANDNDYVVVLAVSSERVSGRKTGNLQGICDFPAADVSITAPKSRRYQ